MPHYRVEERQICPSPDKGGARSEEGGKPVPSLPRKVGALDLEPGRSQGLAFLAEV